MKKVKEFLKTFYFIFSQLFIMASLIGFPFLVNGIIDGPWGFIIYVFTGRYVIQELKKIGKKHPGDI